MTIKYEQELTVGKTCPIIDCIIWEDNRRYTVPAPKRVNLMQCETTELQKSYYLSILVDNL